MSVTMVKRKRRFAYSAYFGPKPRDLENSSPQPLLGRLGFWTWAKSSEVGGGGVAGFGAPSG